MIKQRSPSWRSRIPKGAAAAVLASMLILLAASAAVTAPAPQEVPVPGSRLQYEVSVVLKLIHVYVTDKKGKPVEDLTRDDFVVTDNGKPVTLTDFERHLLRAPAEKAGEAPATAPAPTSPLSPAPASARRMNRKFFLFFDFAFNSARGLAKAQKAALGFLADQLRPEDEVGVLSYSAMKGVTVHEYLTTDHAKVREVVGALGSKAIMGRASEIEEQYWRQAQMERPPGREGDTILSVQAFQRQESKGQARLFIEKMTALAKALRGVPGQKHFIMFSTGIPASIIYGGQAGTPDASGRGTQRFDSGDRVLRTLNEDLYKEFGASGCVFYAFDTRESAKPMSLFGYDEQTFEQGSRDILRGESVFQDAMGIFRDEKTTGGNSLKRITDVTGGKYFGNINLAAKNLDQVQALTGSYYVLGYSIGEQQDGLFHELKVQVRRRDCEVRAQAGYFSPKPYALYSDLEKQLQLYDLALNEQSSFRMPVNFPLTTLAVGTGGVEAGLEVLARLPGEVTRRFSGEKAEFVALVFDEKGDVRSVRRLECDPRPHRGQDVVFTAGAALKPGTYTCRLVVRDMASGMSAVASRRATVTAAPVSGLRMGTPLLLVAGTGSIALDGDTAKAKGIPWWREEYPYDRISYSPIAGEISRFIKKLVAVVPCAVPGTAEPDLVLSGHLIDASNGRRLPVEFSLLSRAFARSSMSLTLEFPVEGLAPGRYILYVNAEDRTSKSMGHAQTGLTISGD
jgi:VWFA-related protein